MPLNSEYVQKKGDEILLTAKLKSGEMISLGDKHPKEYLFELRKKEAFYCRDCGAKLILKLGTKRIYHFAHEKGAVCTNNYERESEYHMQGKLDLYEWLHAQGLQPQLEPYFPEIKQRADIAFTYEGTTYCIEYQCSTISEELFRKRTAGYRMLSLTPIWILGGENIKRQNGNQIALSSFQFLFVSQNSTEKWYFLAYCPQIKKWINVHHIVPLTTRNAYIQFQLTPLFKQRLQDLLDPHIFSKFSLDQWRQGLKRVKKSLLLTNPSKRNPFLAELYTHSLHPQLLPPYVGLPLLLNPIIETSPFVWQAYLFIDHLFQQQSGKIIYSHDVFSKMVRRIRRDEVKLRSLPHIKENLFRNVLDDYLFFLAKHGILVKQNHKRYIIKKNIRIAKTVDEAFRLEELFYKKISRKR